MSLQDIVNVTISKQSSSVSRQGFGTPMVLSAEAAEDARFATAAKAYGSTTEMGSTGDGFDTAGVTFLMAQRIFSQNPKVDQVIVGKRASAPLMTTNMIPIVKADTDYVVTVGGRGVAGGDIEAFTFDSGGSPTVASIITGVVALINAGAQKVLASDNTTSMDVESSDTPGGSATAGKPYTIAFDRSLWTAQNVTPDPGIVADLSTVRTALDGNDDWYALHADSFGKAEITSLAAEIETLRRIYLPTTFDADVLTASTTDIASVLQGLNYARTALSWHETPGSADMGAAWGGRALPTDPGSITWKFKTLVGIVASTLTPTELTNIEAKSANNYITIAGEDMTEEGVTASGEFIDVTRGIDFITARLEEKVFARMKELPKISYTDKGIAIIEAEVRGVMQLGISQEIFTPDPAPVVTAPAANSVSPTDRGNRFLPDMNFTAQLAGAIHAAALTGVVTV